MLERCRDHLEPRLHHLRRVRVGVRARDRVGVRARVRVRVYG